MILSGKEIERELGRGIVIDPFDPTKLNPNSYNLTLHKELRVYKESCLDLKRDNETEIVEIPDSGLILQPNTVYLGRTVEWTETDKFVPMLEGRSSLGRLGVSIHVCAGFGDVGFKGTWTLEVTAVTPVRVYSGVSIAQIIYLEIKGEHSLYKGKYHGQIDPKPSRFWMEVSDAEKNRSRHKGSD